ncbi:MAG: putative 4-hydroxybenzoate polyprenyltransferase [Chloroflexi bacterium]|nr:putative 4-hydroxybenzoate polyprenyltransferase [Chloroflexota bacterium]
MAVSRARVYLESIRFEHTIFALPFAYIGMLLAADGWPGWDKFLLITAAMAGARTAAMAINRLVDAELDARNPRTSDRALPAGLMRRREMAALAIAGAVVLVLSAWRLNLTALVLAPVALFVVCAYPYTKRFTWSTHWILGLADSIAPAGAWIGVRGDFGLEAALISLAMLFWIAGFDLIYACQDVDVDRRDRLHSVPARFGIAAALWTSRGCHAATVVLLVSLGLVAGLGWPYWIGVLAAAALLAYESTMVSPTDLGRLQKAFFDMNGYVSVALLIAVSVSYVLG